VGRDGSATIHLAPLSVRVFDVGSAQATPSKPNVKKGAKKAGKGSRSTKAANGAKPAKGAAPLR
jgi:hypothetical protein